MEFENIYKVETLTVNYDEKYVNALLDAGWKLLAIKQFQNDSFSCGHYVLGADKETSEKINLESIKNYESENKDYGWENN